MNRRQQDAEQKQKNDARNEQTIDTSLIIIIMILIYSIIQ